MLIQTADRCTQQHIQLLVIGCVNSYQNKLISIQYKAVNKLLRQYLQQKGIHYIDVFPAMEAKKAAGELLFLEDNYHLSTAGHAVLAEELYRSSSKTVHALTSL
ncbi:SGNH/GDSL hydrolase family protein [Phnomibacter ginsenosidimutans]|uniref:SGNH/GDSL hydrolase family protein n=1 Tax=Phnomibacter ginsenosidimutans TaxID=2676868 RepID=UPI0018D235D4|nr:SGNH/GDSL hydrolase family protein [Phnomibacter ginsenosidimutans]